MHIFGIAILIGLVIRLICNLGIYLYMRSNKTEEEIRSKVGWQILIFVYVTNKMLLIVHMTIFAAIAIKPYLPS